MSKQLSLFEEALAGWISRLWTTVDPDKRREVVTILAEMGRKAVVAKGLPGRPRKEGDDES